MARQVLDHGVIIPAEYSDDWYEDMSTNLNKLDEVIGSDADKLSEADVSEVALSGDYDDLTNKPDLKPVATSGDYDDLTNKPNYGILRMTSETLSDSGSGAISNLNSDSKLAAGDYVLDAALKVFPITAVSAPNYTVGTSLFQITNASALAAVATSGSYDDLNNLPTYGITRFVNAAITDNSNVAFANISSVDKIKAGDFLLDNAGKMYLIASVDTVNETAAVTTPLTVLALDANVMHLSGNETAAGQKTFSGGMALNSLLNFTNSLVTKGTIPQSTVNPYRIYFGSGVNYGASLFNIDTSVSNTGVQSFIFRSAENVVSGDDARFALIYDPNRTQPRYLSVKGGIEPNANNTYDCGSGTNIWKDLYCYHGHFRGQQQNDEYSGNARTNLTLLANRDTSGQSCCVVDTFRENTAQGTGSHIIGFGIKENSIRYEGCRFSWLWDNNLHGYSFSIRPTLQGANQAVEHCIGLSTDKWDKINGINPGALSLPDLNNGIDISGYIDVNTTSEYTSLSNGYISICGTASATNAIAIKDKNFDYAVTGRAMTISSMATTYVLIPVLSNHTYEIICNAVSSIVWAKFFPNLGNV